jgi:hypothetical protein
MSVKESRGAVASKAKCSVLSVKCSGVKFNFEPDLLARSRAGAGRIAFEREEGPVALYVPCPAGVSGYIAAQWEAVRGAHGRSKFGRGFKQKSAAGCHNLPRTNAICTDGFEYGIWTHFRIGQRVYNARSFKGLQQRSDAIYGLDAILPIDSLERIFRERSCAKLRPKRTIAY